MILGHSGSIQIERSWMDIKEKRDILCSGLGRLTKMVYNLSGSSEKVISAFRAADLYCSLSFWYPDDLSAFFA